MQEGDTMSISKSYNKQNGVTYVYEVYENYWNKEKKRPESKRRLIGKINPETGEIVPTSKAKKRADKNEDNTQDYRTQYEETKKKAAQQEKEIADLKNKLSSDLSRELEYLSIIEQETMKRRKTVEGLLRKLKKYG